MQILKFGGSSVENADNISRVAGIIKKASRKDKTIVVVSAMGGITDSLLKTAILAASADKSYINLLQEIENRHIGSIAIPPLGCGLGGLNWATQVHPLIWQHLNELPDTNIYILLPS